CSRRASRRRTCTDICDARVTPVGPSVFPTKRDFRMLRIAVPNKGSLSETAAQMLSEAGYAGRRDPKELHLLDAPNGVEFFFLRPRDIATYVGSGALDVGVTGRDLLLDSGSEASE